MTGSKTEPSTRWISFVNDSGSVIPSYGIVAVKPYVDSLDPADLDNDERIDLTIRWKVTRAVFPSMNDILADPAGVEYPQLFAINSGAQVPIDATGRMTFATDGPAWVRVNQNADTGDFLGLSDTIGDQNKWEIPIGTPVGPTGNSAFTAKAGSIGFRTVSVTAEIPSSNDVRVQVIADPGPYEMRLVSVGIFGGYPVKPEDIVAVTTTAQGPHPIGVCVPSTTSTPSGSSTSEFIVPVHFDRQNLLYLCHGAGTEVYCSEVPLACRGEPLVMVNKVQTRNIWPTKQNTRYYAIGGLGKSLIKGAKSVGADGTKVRLLCDEAIGDLGTVATDGLPSGGDNPTIVDGALLTIQWDGCKAYIAGVDDTCPEEAP